MKIDKETEEITTGQWHVQHDDEVWCGELHVLQCTTPEIAYYVVGLHNSMVMLQRDLRRLQGDARMALDHSLKL